MNHWVCKSCVITLFFAFLISRLQFCFCSKYYLSSNRNSCIRESRLIQLWNFTSGLSQIASFLLRLTNCDHEEIWISWRQKKKFWIFLDPAQLRAKYILTTRWSERLMTSLLIIQYYWVLITQLKWRKKKLKSESTRKWMSWACSLVLLSSDSTQNFESWMKVIKKKTFCCVFCALLINTFQILCFSPAHHIFSLSTFDFKLTFFVRFSRKRTRLLEFNYVVKSSIRVDLMMMIDIANVEKWKVHRLVLSTFHTKCKNIIFAHQNKLPFRHQIHWIKFYKHSQSSLFVVHILMGPASTLLCFLSCLALYLPTSGHVKAKKTWISPSRMKAP